MATDMKTWLASRIKEDQKTRYMDNGADFIDDAAIFRALKGNAAPAASQKKISKSNIVN